MPEREAVPGYLTGHDFVRLNADLQGMPDAAAATDRAIATVDLTEAAHRPPAHLLEGHAPAGQARRRARPRAAHPAARRAVQRDGSAPAAAHDGSAARDGRRRARDPVLLAHPRGGRAAGRRRARGLRGPAGGIGRLPLDPPADDRPAPPLHDPLVRRPRRSPRRCCDSPRSSAPSSSTACSPSGRPITAPSRGSSPRRRARPASGSTRSGRPTTRSRACSATWSADDGIRGARRRDAARSARSAADPADGPAGGAAVLVGLLIRLGGGRNDAPEILDTLVIRTVLPLIALVIGTATIGSEIEDGTVVFLLAKPIARWRTALAKLGVAAGLTAALAVPPIIVTSAPGRGIRRRFAGDGLRVRARGHRRRDRLCRRVRGPRRASRPARSWSASAYTLLWEGVLAGLLEGTRFMSIRQGTLGVAAALTGEDVGVDVLAPVVSVADPRRRRGRRVPDHDPGADPLPGSLGRLIAGDSASGSSRRYGTLTTTVWRRPSRLLAQPLGRLVVEDPLPPAARDVLGDHDEGDRLRLVRRPGRVEHVEVGEQRAGQRSIRAIPRRRAARPAPAARRRRGPPPRRRDRPRCRPRGRRRRSSGRR